MKKSFFVAGTNTDVGKTYVAHLLLKAAQKKGLSTLGLKPVAAGGLIDVDGEMRNEDAVSLMAASTKQLSYAQVNPVCLEAAIAPHIAAAEEGKRLRASDLTAKVRGALMSPAEFNLIEGAGGWRVPLNEREYLSELPKQLDLPVILVVGMSLGCLSHAYLTVEAIRRDGLQLAGWVANTIGERMDRYDENLDWMRHTIPAPCLGVLDYCVNEPEDFQVDKLDISPLLTK